MKQVLWVLLLSVLSRSGLAAAQEADAGVPPGTLALPAATVKPAGAAGEYLATLLANPHMQEWATAARAETESIPEEDLYG